VVSTKGRTGELVEGPQIVVPVAGAAVFDVTSALVELLPGCGLPMSNVVVPAAIDTLVVVDEAGDEVRSSEKVTLVPLPSWILALTMGAASIAAPTQVPAALWEPADSDPSPDATEEVEKAEMTRAGC
jgi:hypothetical protein